MCVPPHFVFSLSLVLSFSFSFSLSLVLLFDFTSVDCTEAETVKDDDEDVVVDEATGLFFGTDDDDDGCDETESTGVHTHIFPAILKAPKIFGSTAAVVAVGAAVCDVGGGGGKSGGGRSGVFAIIDADDEDAEDAVTLHGIEDAEADDE